MCADDANDLGTNGNKIQIYHCDGAASQQLTLESNGTIEISGGCLDNTNGRAVNGNPIQLYQCISGDANQQWQSQPDGEIINLGTAAAGTPMCLDNYDVAATDHGTVNGTQLDVWGCNGDANQLWTLPYSDPVGLDRIVSAYPATQTMCLDDHFGRYDNGNVIDAYQCNDTQGAQAWTVAANGTLQIGGDCADVYLFGVTDGTKVQLYQCTGGTNQQWRILSDGEIVGLDSGSCLYEGDTPVNSLQLTISSCNSTDSGQIWLLSPYKSNYGPHDAPRHARR
jgi:hypothetical protein